VELLLESGADINVWDNNDKSPFDVASYNVARFLAECLGLAPPEAGSYDGPDPDQLLLDEDTPNNGDEMTIMMHDASASGRLTIIRSLLDRGIDVNSRNTDRETSLHVASEQGRLEVARLLIDRGADVNCRDNVGQTPLHMSSESGHLDVSRLLLDHGAHVDTACQHRNTALHRTTSISGGRHFEVARLLIERGANANAVGNYGLTPLRMAQTEEEPNLEVIQLLMKHGAI